MTDTTEDLARRRGELLTKISDLGDLYRGTLNSQYRKCGKPSCRCAEDETRMHGPYWVLSWADRETGRTRSRSVPSDAVETVRAQVDEYHRARDLTDEFFEVSSRLCDAMIDGDAPGDRQKRGALNPRS